MAKQSRATGQRRGVSGPPASARGIISSAPVSLETAQAAVEYWTEAAMRDAEPYPLPEVEEGAGTQLGEVGGVSEGGPPEAPSDQPTDAEPQATTGGYDYPGPFTRFEVQEVLYKLYPWSTVGKVFFTQNGRNYVASASSIGKKAIWTAGHVVHAGDNKTTGWSTNMIFVPAYRDGNAPFGKWSAVSLSTRTLWYQKGNPDGLTEDMGGAVLDTLNGKMISQVVGWLGFAWNYPRFQHWDSLGYPAAAPFNGERMHDCEASYAYNGTVSGIPPVAIGCDLTGGCSGGPWVIQFQTSNYVNGHNSYRRSDRPLEMNSPYFDDRAKSLFDTLMA